MTTPMTSLISGMTSTDIVRIIKACSEASVNEFILDGMEIYFSERPDTVAAPLDLVYDNIRPTSERVEADELEEEEDESLFLDPISWDENAKKDAE